jgi:2-phospho-L-lactate guanylyltransferase
MRDIWALVPIKLTVHAKQRLSAVLPPPVRQRLALAMATDVLAALAATPGLAGLAVVTVDEEAAALARAHGARVITDGALDGHTGAVEAGARRLAADGAQAVLTMPLDVPGATPAEISRVLAASQHGTRSFTIVPAHDRMGSNCVVSSPPGCVKLRFGEDSFHPHLAASRAAGIEPTIVEAPGIALDIDHPADLDAFLALPPTTRAHAVLQEFGMRRAA